MLEDDRGIDEIDRCVLELIEACRCILNKGTIGSAFFLSGSEVNHASGNIDSVADPESLGQGECQPSHTAAKINRCVSTQRFAAFLQTRFQIVDHSATGGVKFLQVPFAAALGIVGQYGP